MSWTIRTFSYNRCVKQIPWFKTEAMYCMENDLPQTNTITFKKKGHSEIHLDKYYYRKVDPPKGNDVYREACSGDSGSGQFIKNNVEYTPENFDRFKYIQVAVYSWNSANILKHGGKKYDLPCGSYTYNMNESKKENEKGKNEPFAMGKHKPWSMRVYSQSQSISMRITSPKILRWIKMQIGICKDGESCIIS